MEFAKQKIEGQPRQQHKYFIDSNAGFLVDVFVMVAYTLDYWKLEVAKHWRP